MVPIGDIVYREQGRKGTGAHKAAVVGDTVGDPFKDTSGPSLNILLKLMSVVALVIAPSIALDAETITAHNMESIELTEQVVISETSEEELVKDEKTMVVETEMVSEKKVEADKKEDSEENTEK